LVFHPQLFALGVGCARNADPAELAELVSQTLADAGIAAGAIHSVSSLDLKGDEPAMNQLAAQLGVPVPRV
jgi:cobalt-precorrin 5A hydrolase/precorrin-3B C17-methyltransferase